MKKFYKIPMTERIIKVGNTSLLEILQNNYPLLYDREKGRINLQYHVLLTKEKLEEYNRETNLMYAKEGIPKYIIAVGNNNYLMELSTGIKLSGIEHSSILKERRVSKEDAYEYISNEKDYVGNVTKLFSKEIPKSLKKINKPSE